LITGASAGLGAEFARQLARSGHDVMLVARRAERLQALAAQLAADHGIVADYVATDLATPAAVPSIVAALGGRSVDMLVNNAGYTIAAEFAATDWATQRDCLNTLVGAVVELTHAVLPGMLDRGAGGIITVSSILALSQGGRGHTLYPAAKSFVHKFMLSLDAEVRTRGIHCTSVLPGSTASEFRQANGIGGTPGGPFVSGVSQVVRAAIAGNARGRVIVIPGWHNRLAALVMKLAPDALIRFVGRQMT
jgi:short-subunit dehydrogenase